MEGANGKLPRVGCDLSDGRASDEAYLNSSHVFVSYPFDNSPEGLRGYDLPNLGLRTETK